MSLLEKIRRRENAKAALLLEPTIAFLIVFFVMPFIITVLYSFGSRDPFGRLILGFSLKHYSRVLDSAIITIMVRSIGIGLLTTVLCLLLGYPMAYYISVKSGKFKNTAVLLAIIPFWTSFLIRTYALMGLFTSNGFINTGLMNAGFIENPLNLMYNIGTVMVGMVYNYLILMILPLYASIEKLDLRLLEAASSASRTVKSRGCRF